MAQCDETNDMGPYHGPICQCSTCLATKTRAPSSNLPPEQMKARAMINDSYNPPPRQSCPTCGATWQGNYYVHFCPGPKNPWGRNPWYPNPGSPTVPDPYVSPSEPLRASGWLCPACGRGNAPFVAQCGCQGAATVTTTTGTATALVTSTPKVVECDCCGVNVGTTSKEVRGYTVCDNCYRYHMQHFNPGWHSGSPEDMDFYETVLPTGKPLRRYYLSDGTTYFNNEDSDDYK